MAQTFYIHNTTRSPHTRDVRRSVPGPESSTKNIFIGGGLLRVVRGRPVPVAEAFLRRHVPELLAKEKKGLIAVYNAKTQRVDLSTLEVLPSAPPPPPVTDDAAGAATAHPPATPATNDEVPAPVIAEPLPVPAEDPAPPVEETPTDVLSEVQEVPAQEPAPVEEAPAAPVAPATNPFFSGKKKNRR